jgi:uncharacterized protein
LVVDVPAAHLHHELELELDRFVDHHCHGLDVSDLDRPAFEALMSEADGPSPLGTTAFDSMLGLAVRRWCAPVLGLPPLASPDDYVARRRELGGAEASRRLVASAGISTFLVDTGISSKRVGSPHDVAMLAGGTAHEIVRLERLAEDLLDESVEPDQFGARFEERLRVSEAIGAKSIAAYRVGLDLPGVKPSARALEVAVSQLGTEADGGHRLAHPVVHAWLAWTAVEIGMPLQFHAGYGDKDLDLRRCDPLRLTAFLEATRTRGVPIVLLHNYPFHRNAAYLAQVFDHVFIDIGLATHNAGALSDSILRESLELAPFGKLLFATDAYGLAEHYVLGALLFRRALTRVLGSLLVAGEMGADDALRLGRLIGRENAERVYAIGSP